MNVVQYKFDLPSWKSCSVGRESAPDEVPNELRDRIREHSKKKWIFSSVFMAYYEIVMGREIVRSFKS